MINPPKRQAYDVVIRRVATGCDYTLRIFCIDAATAERSAKARFQTEMRRVALHRHEHNGAVVFRVVSCTLSADQSRPSEA